jgi:hypothetical protein
MTLPSMPGADQAGYAGFSDQVDHDCLATFGSAAVVSLISAGQAEGQMATFGRRRQLRTLRLPTTQSLGDGEPERGLRRLGAIRVTGSADDGTGPQSAGDSRDQAGLPIRRDDHSGPCIPRSLQRLNVHKSYTNTVCDCAQNGHKIDSRRMRVGVLKRKEEPTQTILAGTRIGQGRDRSAARARQ